MGAYLVCKTRIGNQRWSCRGVSRTDAKSPDALPADCSALYPNGNRCAECRPVVGEPVWVAEGISRGIERMRGPREDDGIPYQDMAPIERAIVFLDIEPHAAPRLAPHCRSDVKFAGSGCRWSLVGIGCGDSFRHGQRAPDQILRAI